MSQRKLIARCKKHPGLLSEQLLNKMQDAVGFEGERPETDSASLPASAKAYFLRVLKNDPDLQEAKVPREMQFLGSMLDHLVLGRTGEAADFVTQRLKAVERAAKDKKASEGRLAEGTTQLTAAVMNFLKAKGGSTENLMQNGAASLKVAEQKVERRQAAVRQPKLWKTRSLLYGQLR